MLTINTNYSSDDIIHCYDSTADTSMNTINYPTTVGNSTGYQNSNIYITNTGTTTPNWNITDTISIGPISQTPLKVHGDAEIEGKLKLGGKDIGELIEKLEERLAILHPNVELEDRWEELKDLGRRYRELEQDILEKEKIFNILKK